MADRNNPVTLTSPSGHSVKCAANKRFALTVHVRRNDETRLVVLFRTNDQEAAIKRGIRESKARRSAVGFHSLDTGRLLGHWGASTGTFIQSIPVTTGARK